MTSRGGFVLWLTGCPAAGKTTLARALAPALSAGRHVEILDGDEVRRRLSRGLGFSRADRDAHVERVGRVARILARGGVAVIAAVVSPYAAARDAVRARCARDGTPFVEVFVDAPLAVRVARDPKGLYRRALAGEVPGFTGVSDPYEPPATPDVTVRSDQETVEESARRVLASLRDRGLIGTQPERAGWAAGGRGRELEAARGSGLHCGHERTAHEDAPHRVRRAPRCLRDAQRRPGRSRSRRGRAAR